VIVVDTNAIVHLLIGSDRTDAALRVFGRDHEWAAPILWRSEFRNVLCTLVRHRSLAVSDALETAREAETLLAGNEFGVETQAVIELAAQSGCSAYDCEFVALAGDLAVPLVTSDRQILAAFPKRAVAIEAFAPKPR
jgi:predicted nucleic acid-binding protein